MTDEELKNKCKERAKIFQQAMESCHSNNPIDCIEWFADRIAELEAQVTRAFEVLEGKRKQIADLTEQNTSLLTSVENLNKSVQELEAQIEKMKLCQICKHYQWESCSYHSLWEKDCKANNHKLFELVGDKRK